MLKRKLIIGGIVLKVITIIGVLVFMNAPLGSNAEENVKAASLDFPSPQTVINTKSLEIVEEQNLEIEVKATEDTSFIKQQIQQLQEKMQKEEKVEFDPTTIFISGDTMVGRYVETLMNRNSQQYPFQALKEYIEPFDIAITNLEGPIPVTHRQTPDFTTNFSFKPETVNTLKDAGFTTVTLANNHTADKGLENLENTRRILTEGGIEHFGDPIREESMYALHQYPDNRHLIWLGFHDATRRFDTAKAVDVIQEHRTMYPQAIVFVSIHWGPEYQLTSNGRQKEVAHKLADAGAHMIIGHHPHVVQEVEIYNGRPIFYSLGNFVFDQYFSRNTQEGLTLAITITDDQIQTEIQPIQINRSQAQFMTEPRRSQFMQELADRSTQTHHETIKAGKLITTY